MDEQMYVTLHQAASQFALEAVRTLPSGSGVINEPEEMSKAIHTYRITYGQTISMLANEHQKHTP